MAKAVAYKGLGLSHNAYLPLDSRDWWKNEFAKILKEYRDSLPGDHPDYFTKQPRVSYWPSMFRKYKRTYEDFLEEEVRLGPLDFWGRFLGEVSFYAFVDKTEELDTTLKQLQLEYIEGVRPNARDHYPSQQTFPSTVDHSISDYSNKYVDSVKSTSDILPLLEKLKGNWVIYYRDPASTRFTVRIGRGILSIGCSTDGSVSKSPYYSEIRYKEQRDGLVSKENAKILTGSIDGRSTTSHLLFNFTFEGSKNTKPLHMRFHIGSVSHHITAFSVDKPDLYLGLYMDHDDYRSLHGGTIVMHRDPDTIEELLPGIIPQREAEFDNIPPFIARFLEDKRLNYLKIPHKVYTSTGLTDWLDYRWESEDNPKRHESRLRIPYYRKHDLLVLTPIRGFEKKSDFDIFRRDVNNMINDESTKAIFKKLGFNSVVYAPNLIEEDIKEHLDDEELRKKIDVYESQGPPNIALERALRHFWESGAYLFITPSRLASSIHMQIGWAMWFRRPTLLIYTEGQKNPYPYLARGTGKTFSYMKVSDDAILINNIPQEMVYQNFRAM